MVEELKIVSEILMKMTDGALTGLIAYMVINALTQLATFAIVGFSIFKSIKVVFHKTTNVVEIKNVDKAS